MPKIDIPRNLITNTHYNLRSNIPAEIDNGYVRLYIAVCQQGIQDEIREARTQLGFYSQSHVRLKDGDISDKLYQRILETFMKKHLSFRTGRYLTMKR